MTSPASGPLGNTTCTSNPSAFTVRGTRTECAHSRPQLNPDSHRSRVTLPVSVNVISAGTSRPYSANRVPTSHRVRYSPPATTSGWTWTDAPGATPAPTSNDTVTFSPSSSL